MKQLLGRRPVRQRTGGQKMNIGVYQESRKRSRVWPCPNLSDTAALAVRLVREADAHVWLLRGPLGSGKSTFARRVLRALRYRGSSPSPTYTLSRIYALAPKQRWCRVLHIDAYRIVGRHEEAALDLAAAINDPECLVLIEWPEKLRVRPWKRALTVSFSLLGRGRLLTLSQPI